MSNNTPPRRPSAIESDMKELVAEMANYADHAEDMERAWKRRAERLEAWLRYYATKDPMARATIEGVLGSGNLYPPACPTEGCRTYEGHAGECGR